MAGACDQGKQHDAPRLGPHLQLLGANVGPNVPIDARGTIQLAFDRFLLPYSVNRQSVVLREAGGNAVTSPVITYDPAARVVTLRAPVEGPWLVPGQPYVVALGIPNGDDDSGGLRAIDRATLDPSLPPSSRLIGFQTCAEGTSCGGVPSTPARVAFCNDVLPIFTKHCSAGICHSAPSDATTGPAASLVLTTSIGVAKTAIGRVAQGSNTGPVAGRAEPPGHVFGVDMPIIAPGSPADSWLMYKLLLAEPRADDAGAPAVRPRCYIGETPNAPSNPFPGGVVSFAPFTPVAADERARLSDWVLGSAMPYPSSDGVSFAEIERVRVWIEQGAVVEECGACEP